MRFVISCCHVLLRFVYANAGILPQMRKTARCRYLDARSGLVGAFNRIFYALPSLTKTLVVFIGICNVNYKVRAGRAVLGAYWEFLLLDLGRPTIQCRHTINNHHYSKKYQFYLSSNCSGKVKVIFFVTLMDEFKNKTRLILLFPYGLAITNLRLLWFWRGFYSLVLLNSF